jgi:adenosine deaminase
LVFSKPLFIFTTKRQNTNDHSSANPLLKSQQKTGSAKLKTIKILVLVSYTDCVIFLGQNNVIKIKTYTNIVSSKNSTQRFSQKHSKSKLLSVALNRHDELIATDKKKSMITKTLPLTDIHRHLDGNIRIQTILDLGQQYNLDLPAYDIESLRPHVQVMDNQPDLLSFLSKLDWGVKVLASLDACKRIAFENMQDAAQQGLDYVELRFSPGYMGMTHQLPLEGVVEAVIAGVKEGSQAYGVKANLIGIMSRTFGQEACEKELNALLAHKNDIKALDLAGDELGFPGNLFIDHFKKARNAGWHITVHAGEAAGPESIWQAIEELGAERIGHGVKAVQDLKLLDYLAKHQIGIESCLTSNIQTNTVPSLTEHPLKTFLEHGVLATINTDDPAVEGIEIQHEYLTAAPLAGLSPEQIYTAQENGLKIAFLSDQEKDELRQKYQ